MHFFSYEYKFHLFALKNECKCTLLDSPLQMLSSTPTRPPLHQMGLLVLVCITNVGGEPGWDSFPDTSPVSFRDAAPMAYSYGEITHGCRMTRFEQLRTFLTKQLPNASPDSWSDKVTCTGMQSQCA